MLATKARSFAVLLLQWECGISVGVGGRGGTISGEGCHICRGHICTGEDFSSLPKPLEGLCQALVRPEVRVICKESPQQRREKNKFSQNNQQTHPEKVVSRFPQIALLCPEKAIHSPLQHLCIRHFLKQKCVMRRSRYLCYRLISRTDTAAWPPN